MQEEIWAQSMERMVNSGRKATIFCSATAWTTRLMSEKLVILGQESFALPRMASSRTPLAVARRCPQTKDWARLRP